MGPENNICVIERPYWFHIQSFNNTIWLISVWSFKTTTAGEAITVSSGNEELIPSNGDGEEAATDKDY